MVKSGSFRTAITIPMNKRQAIGLLLVPLALPARAAAAPTPQAASPTPGERLLTEFWAKVYNPPYDLATIDRLCTEDFILTSAGQDIVGRAAFRQWVENFTARIGEVRLTNVDMFSSADGTRVVSRWKATGFNRGVFGLPADNRPIEFTGVAIWEIRDSKLAHNWVERSSLELVRRLEKPAP